MIKKKACIYVRGKLRRCFKSYSEAEANCAGFRSGGNRCEVVGRAPSRRTKRRRK
jgi:hypothetical protein